MPDATSTYSLSLLDRPKCLVPLPAWPGERMAVKLAISGAMELPQLAIGFDFLDGSAIALEYLTELDPETPQEVYDHCGGLPLLKVLVFDRGRPRPHEADRAWKELEKYMGTARPLSIIGAAVDSRRGRRAHWWHAEG